MCFNVSNRQLEQLLFIVSINYQFSFFRGLNRLFSVFPLFKCLTVVIIPLIERI